MRASALPAATVILLAAGCPRSPDPSPRQTATTSADAAPAVSLSEWARAHVAGEPRITPLTGDLVPGTQCSEVRGSGERAQRVVACVHPSAGVLSGREGFARWLRARGFRLDSPATGAVAMLRAFDALTGREGYTAERGWHRRFGDVLVVEVDGREGERRFARVLEVREDGTPTEGPTPVVTEDVAPTGEAVTHFRDHLGERADRFDTFQLLREFSDERVTCFQALATEQGSAQPLAACLHGSEVLAGAAGVAGYLRARGFTPAQPVIDPAKLLTFVTLMTGAWGEYRFTNVTSRVEAAGLVITGEALPRAGATEPLVRVLTIAPDGVVREGWRRANDTAVTPGLPAQGAVSNGPP
jgi:hypothetical protein